jgi:hypothetical protein
MNEIVTGLHVDEEEKITASMIGRTTHLDEYLVFEMYIFEKEERKPPSNQDLYGRIGESLSRSEIDEALHRLLTLGLIILVSQLNGINRYGVSNVALKSRNLPDNHEEITEDKIKEMRNNKVREAKKHIDSLKKIINLPKKIDQVEEEISNMYKNIERVYERMLRSMISIFGIFVAIFSFIIIGANTAIKIQFTQGPCEILLKTSAFLLPFLLFLSLLILISFHTTRK